MAKYDRTYELSGHPRFSYGDVGAEAPVSKQGYNPGSNNRYGCYTGTCEATTSQCVCASSFSYFPVNLELELIRCWGEPDNGRNVCLRNVVTI